MSLLGINGGLAFFLSACKEEVCHMVGKAVGFAYDKYSMDYIMGPDHCDDEIDVEKPGIIIYVDKKDKFSAARRINKVVKKLHKRHELDKPSVYMFEDSTAILIKVDKWYYKNAVNLSGLLTFIRAASNNDFSFKTLEDFIEVIIGSSQTEDGKHLKLAKENGNLEGFLANSLPIMKREDNGWHKGRQTETPWDGIVCYDSNEIDYSDISSGLSWDNEDDYGFEECQCPDCVGDDDYDYF